MPLKRKITSYAALMKPEAFVNLFLAADAKKGQGPRAISG